MAITIKELAKQCDAGIIGNDSDILIESASDISSAQENQVTILNDLKFSKFLPDTKASACFMNQEMARLGVPEAMAILVSKDPEISFIKAVKLLHPEKQYPPEIAAQTAVAETASLADNVYLAEFSSIGEHSQIGENSQLLTGVRIGDHVKIGTNCRIYPNVVIYDHTQIGNNVIIHAGSVIGADGFGYKQRNQKHIKVPHVGYVRIENNVEIGANTCIDRGTFGETVIGEGSKVDNLVQIGHNNIIGENVIICGQTGISGSCQIENNVILAGSAGLADHVKIGHHAVVMARSGIASDIEACTQVFGSPAKDKKVAWRELAALAKLPQLMKTIKLMESRLRKLEK
jgi:UDP-3-O-[3-hydroxymyristoyl] glucosamine N-acyltransferase